MRIAGITKKSILENDNTKTLAKDFELEQTILIIVRKLLKIRKCTIISCCRFQIINKI